MTGALDTGVCTAELYTIAGTVVGVVFGSLGVVITIVALAVFCQVLGLVWGGTRTAGKVVSHDSELGTIGMEPSSEPVITQRFYHPNIQFKDESGKMHIVRSRMGANRRRFRVGEEVPIMYWPADPKKTMAVDRFFEKWVGPGVMLLLGLACLFVSGWWRFLGR